MKEPQQINKPINLVYTEVKRKLEDNKTNWFIVITLINVFMLGLLLSEYRHLLRNYESLQDAHALTQVIINKMKGDKNE